MYLRLNHKIDIYSKSVLTNVAGQKQASWTADIYGQRCEMEGWVSNIRVNPTSEESDEIYLYMDQSAVIDYGKRIYNITDRTGNQIYTGPFEVVKITKLPGYTGKIRHQKVLIRSVIE